MDIRIDKKRLIKERNQRIAKVLITLLAIVIVVLFVINWLRSSVKISDISISKVDIGDVEITISATGRVVPAFEEVINSPINSRIVDVYKHSGDSVVKGEAIMKLDLISVEIELKKLQDEMSMKRLQFQQLKLNNRGKISELTMNLEIETIRQEQLKEQLINEIYLDSLGSGTPSSVRKSRIDVELGEKELSYKKSELDNQKALLKSDEEINKLELEILERTLQQKERLLDQSQILSPRSSILSFVNSQIGEQVAEGTKIAMLTDLSEFKIDGEIANINAHRVKVGSEVIAVVDNKRMKGVVSNLNPVAVDNTIEFTVQLEDSQDKLLRTGINCDLYIVESRESNTLRIRNISLYNGKGLYELFVLENDMLVKRNVVLGEANFEYVVVESGLKEGDEVVISDLGSKQFNREIKPYS